jgi:hypothetical protein
MKLGGSLKNEKTCYKNSSCKQGVVRAPTRASVVWVLLNAQLLISNCLIVVRPPPPYSRPNDPLQQCYSSAPGGGGRILQISLPCLKTPFPSLTSCTSKTHLWKFLSVSPRAPSSLGDRFSMPYNQFVQPFVLRNTCNVFTYSLVLWFQISFM